MRTDKQRESDRKFNRRKIQEIMRIEHEYAESGKWKTEGCLCGASPSLIHLKGEPYTEMHFGNIVMTQGYECIDCARTYEASRPVDDIPRTGGGKKWRKRR